MTPKIRPVQLPSNNQQVFPDDDEEGEDPLANKGANGYGKNFKVSFRALRDFCYEGCKMFKVAHKRDLLVFSCSC